MPVDVNGSIEEAETNVVVDRAGEEAAIVAYRISYAVAVPSVPSSPGAVHESLIWYVSAADGMSAVSVVTPKGAVSSCCAIADPSLERSLT